MQHIIRYKKGIAIELRKKGMSYLEIQNAINVPKSTVAFWIKDIKLTEPQIQKLKNNRIASAKRNSQKRIFKIKKETEEIKFSSSKAVSQISKRELWLMGIILYWKAGNESNLKKGVQFSSSDPHLIKLFLRWLKEAGKIENEEIIFDILMGNGKKEKAKNAAKYWSQITNFPERNFNHIYFQKGKVLKTQFGILRIRVRASSMLARQIFGWIRGIQEFYR
ncbi:MAG: hypothetical protein A2606_02805 [Candidatus Yanofskybacteria bacterium RIFOXYD1_FULL_42_10]|uniref:Uncharacterized protein n=1 Tax=Candidatus Yanofskybacteria bacterium RIFOXYD1_FULL_42_10 TaxID=1802718 RepID=A0A1F8HV21_9BACT|nr:MAG: hypothetical protein A2606_02805 [Candidatus Yanofskybacteria bacterium RIFOXYD1_FULL_42_10]